MKKILTTFVLLGTITYPVVAAEKLPLTITSGQTKQLQSGDTLVVHPSTTGAASLNIPQGTAPTSPSDGDVWVNTSNLNVRINGSTKVLPALGDANTWSAAQTVTNILSIDQSGTATEAQLSLASDAGTRAVSRYYKGSRTSANLRWRLGKDTASETGTNAGSDFQLERFDDTGSPLGAALSVARSSGAISVPGNMTVSGTINSAKIGRGCANILAYGGDATGATSNNTAFTAAVAGNTTTNICIYFPAGNYQFATTPTITLPSGSSVASVTIRGDGADGTRLLPASGVNGLAINMTGAQQSFHVRDLSILAGNNSTTTKGIVVTQTNATLPNPAASDINGVTIRGSDGYNATFKFGTGIELTSASNVNLVGTTVVGSSGGGAYATVGTCLRLTGSASQIPVQFNIVGSQFNYCLVGISYESYVQGVQISATNFVGNGTGITVPISTTGVDQLAVSASQFNNGTRDIYIASPIDGVTITGSDFYLASGGTAAIQLPGVQYSITGNTFIQFAGTPGNGVVVDSYSLMSGNIGGNSFDGFQTGVVLQSAASNVTLAGNVYSNIVGSAVSNASTTSTSTRIDDPATVSISGTTGLGTGGSVSLESPSDSRAGSIHLTAGSASTAATGSTTLTFGLSAPNRWACVLTPNDTVNVWTKPTTITAAFASRTQVTVNWTNATTALTANGNYYIYYQCLPR